MNFENQIQQWVSIDNQIKIYNEKMKELRSKRNDLTLNITKYAETHKLSMPKIDDGRLKMGYVKVIEPLTFTYLQKSLGEIIKNDSQVKEIISYLKQNRSTRVIPEIKRFSSN